MDVRLQPYLCFEYERFLWADEEEMMAKIEELKKDFVQPVKGGDDVSLPAWTEDGALDERKYNKWWEDFFEWMRR